MDTTKTQEEILSVNPVPMAWVKESLNLLDAQLGKNWRKDYIVWDCTADQKEMPGQETFSKLYRSSPKPTNGDVFKFDFLNEGTDELMTRCPELFMAMDDNEPIVFLFDVPRDKSKAGEISTKTKESMQSYEWGLSSRSIYGQFFYRIYIYKKAFKLTGAHIGVFAPTTYLSSTGFKRFRELFFQEFYFEKGFVFDAAELDQQKEAWSLGFVHFSTKSQTLIGRFPLAQKQKTEEGIKELEATSVYNLDEEISASTWVRAGLRNQERIDLPQFSSALAVKNSRKRGYIGQMGCVNFDGNSVANNHKDVFVVSSTSTRNSNVPILDFNWEKVVTLFAARRAVDRDWTNWQNEYRIPNQEHPIWEQFVADSIVYMMFDSKSNQSSMGNVLYNDRIYDIRNEFFWIHPSKLLKMFSNKGFDDFFKDYMDSEIPFFQKQLETLHLSEKAMTLIESASNLMEISADSRIETHVNRPEWQLYRWDAGYAQLKRVWIKHHNKEYKEFRAHFEDFRKDMRERAHVLGFLG